MLMEPVDHDLESILLGYEGNALFMNGQHERSTEILEIGMRLYPQDYRFQRALATVSEKWAEKVLGLERSKRTWCSSAKRENFNNIFHVVIRITRTLYLYYS